MLHYGAFPWNNRKIKSVTHGLVVRCKVLQSVIDRAIETSSAGGVV